MSDVVIADAQGLIGLLELVTPANYQALFDKVTDCFEKGTLRFPREVIDELNVIARNEFISGWGSGLGANKDLWAPDIVFQRDVMQVVVDLGFESGSESLDGKDPSCLDVARLAFHLSDSKVSFCVLSTDLGTNPLFPTMEQLCTQAEWTLRDPAQCASDLRLLPL